MSTPKVQYSYSEMASGANHSRMTGITYPNGRVVNYNYSGFDDAISRLSELKFGPGVNEKETYTYLGLGTVVVRAHPEPNVNLSYLITGTPDGGDQYVGLDRFSRVVEQRWDKAGTATDRFGYTYDRNSNRLTKSNLLHAPNNETYSYDLLNQLTNFARSTHTQSWNLDALGNWSTFTNDGTPQSRTHNRQNQVTQVGTTNLTFDSNGNTLTTDNGRTLTYDAWNRLISATNGGSTVTFTYDALNRRLTEATAGTTTHLYYSAEWQVLEERLDSATAAKAQYVWSPVYIDALVLRDRDALGDPALEQRSYVQQDANQNVTALVDATGTVVLRMVYDPFGSFTLLTPTWGTPGSTQYSWLYLHQGGRYELVSALYHFRNRDLSPTLGRWIQRDPIEYEAGDPSLYRYESNRPVQLLDPSGQVIPIIIVVGGFAVAGMLLAPAPVQAPGPREAMFGRPGDPFLDQALAGRMAVRNPAVLAKPAGKAAPAPAAVPQPQPVPAVPIAAAALECPQRPKCKKDDGHESGPYAFLEYSDEIHIDHGLPFSDDQRAKILFQNWLRNGGKLKSDYWLDPVQGELVQVEFGGRLRNKPKPKNEQGLKNEAQVDHIKPKHEGGSNSYCNAQVVSQEYNERKQAGKA